MEKYDLIVVGGGFAGVSAAVTAAKEGCHVLIVEKGNSFGGAAINCLVNPFMYYSTKINGVQTELSQGIFKTICQKLKERGALEYNAFLEEELKFILNDLVCDAKIDILFHAYIFDVQKIGSKIKSISVATKSGVVELEADYFIDATGDAQLAFLAGCKTVLGRESDSLCQPMTLCFRLGNVDVDSFMASWDKLKLAHKQALENGELINPRENILVFKLPVPNVLHFNTTRVIKMNPTCYKDVTCAEIIARKQVYEIYEFMKKHADGLENSFLMMTASEIGVRESRRIVGDYILTEQDCKNCTKFDDSIAACNYDIDIHNPEGTGTSHYYFPEGEYYTIPYRSLIPKETDNMLVAGRCISSDHGAQASYRIMPTVCCIGEAAGTAMGQAIKSKCNVRNINIKELQIALKNNGAFIGIDVR
ncbi:MAG: FAD-dependent oxidoreductase [Clostridia bacterium]|nr:FAD-dependent oxidoreductase [Clostridia bacterium]